MDKLLVREGVSLNEICLDMNISRQGVTKHISVLEQANLVVTLKKGREKLHYLNVIPLQTIYSRWITKFDSQRIDALFLMKESLEKDSVHKESAMKGFIYQIVIAADTQKVWNALQMPEFTTKYWFGRILKSDWSLNSEINLVTPEGQPEMKGKIMEYIPFKKLSYTWNTNLQDAETTVVFELEEMGMMTKLTIKHDLDMDDQTSQMAVNGWTMILSGLKTLLETGNPMPVPAWNKK